MVALLINTKIWKQTRCLSGGECINCGTLRQWIIKQWKQWAIKSWKDGGNLNVHYWVKVAYMQMLCTVWFQVYYILKKAKTIETVKNQW